MNIKHAVMIGMMGRVADKFHEYHPPKNLAQRLRDARCVQGAGGIEVVYPSEFDHPDETIKLIKESGLEVSAVNLNVKSEKKWESGSFTSPDARVRRAAVDALKSAMDLAVALGAGMVSCCPLIDGHNFAFEVDYLNQWGWLEEGIHDGAAHRSDVKVSLEYKITESRNFNLLSDMGRALYLCERVGLPNVGVTMDAGHALLARETPAEVMSMASLSGRLFYVHLNDNDRYWDWDMVPGAVNFWDLLEVLFYLEKIDWQGWVAYDVVVRDGGLVETMQAAIENVEAARKLLHKIGVDRLQACIDSSSTAATFKFLIESLL
jgi:xylose isomerase